MTPRFFAFGCSYTAYAWPSWADLVGTHFPHNYYNYGRSGVGNFYIFQRFIHALTAHKFSKDDLVIIQWSASMREDRYIDDNWISCGGLWNYYPEDYIKKYVSERGFLIRDLSLISAVKSILDSIGCEYHFLSLGPIDRLNTWWSTDAKENTIVDNSADLLEIYKDVLHVMKPSYIEVLGGNLDQRTIKNSNIKISDPHPLPSEHNRYLEKVLSQWLPRNTQLAEDLDRTLAGVWITHNQSWDYTWPIDRGFENIEKDL